MKSIMISLTIILLTLGLPTPGRAETKATNHWQQLLNAKQAALNELITRQMKKGRIPGLAVVIVSGEQTLLAQGFGYSNLENKEPVTVETLFELGSNSKAFTGLGILRLEEEGLLTLSQPVTTYLPWLQMYYQGIQLNQQVGHFLHQSSGVKFKSIQYIPIDDSPAALERTVRTLVGQELEHPPGEEFLYATINYDVLGLLIEKISQRRYEDFMQTEILFPLGLEHTYLQRSLAYQDEHMATGYKLQGLQPVAYSAPTYRGNTPAGYIITNATDAARWLKLLCGSSVVPAFSGLIRRSLEPDRSVPPSSEGASYAAGWFINQKGAGEIEHEGQNPNFSAFFTFRPGEQLGVAVLGNLNSAYIRGIAKSIMDTLLEREVKAVKDDQFKSLDTLAVVVICISLLFILTTIYFFAVFMIELFKRKRSAQGFKPGKILIYALTGLCFLGGFAYILYLFPKVFFYELSWEFMRVWAPQTLSFAGVCLLAAAILLTIYFQFIFIFPRQNDKPFFPLVILSFFSGFGNAFIIYIINAALDREGQLTGGLVLYFLLGIILYVAGQKIIRTKMVNITNDLVYTKRVGLAAKLLKATFYDVEKIAEAKIITGLNNDPEMVSQMPDVVIGSLSSLVTLLCCSLYLGIINFYGLCLSLLVICAAVIIYFLAGRFANKLWEQTRDLQNVFMKFINDLLAGFKELYINRLRREQFQQDLNESCAQLKQKRITAELRFANVFVIGELLFVIVIGFIAFVFPLLFPDIDKSVLRTFIFVFIYMVGPIRYILANVPQALRIRIAWNRIKQLDTEFSRLAQEPSPPAGLQSTPVVAVTLKLKDVHFRYTEGASAFIVGPLDCQFSSGEITFITGGNGSGKTTLAKMLTGLYAPQEGFIYLNEQQQDAATLGENFSVVFNAFHLFDKLYGIDYHERAEAILRYLKLLKMEGILEIRAGEFSTLKLSAGQRKRLALLICYLDDKPVFLFDEWAADQDPEFRKFFYEELLQELKAAGKCVIAVTHDDHYFHIADKVIKLEMGRIDTIVINK